MVAKKAIKSFTVDEANHKGLLAFFKKYNVQVSLSKYVNDCMGGLLSYLNDMEAMIKNNKKFKDKDLMSYVIDKKMNPRYKSAEGSQGDEEYYYHQSLESELKEYFIELEANRLRRSTFLQKLIHDGIPFELSKDNNYMINPFEKKKYKTFRTRDGLLTVNLENSEAYNDKQK